MNRYYTIGANPGIGDRLTLGSVSIDLPPLPAFVPPGLPDVGAYARMIEGAASGGAQSVFDSVAMVATLAPPPYGPAVAAGAMVAKGVASFVGGLFGSDEPPEPPSVSGVPRDRLTSTPLADPNTAAIAGRILSGRIKVEGEMQEAIASRALETGGHRALGTAGAGIMAEGGHLDRELRDHGTSLRAVAYFLAYAGYDAVLGARYVNSDADKAQVARFLAWAAPRIQVRELLMYAFAALRLERPPRPSGIPSPGEITAITRAGAFGEVMGGPTGWWQLAKARAVPKPYKSGALWVYAPIPKNVLALELPKYEAPSFGQARLQIVDTISDLDVHPFWMPSVGMTFAQAAAAAYAKGREPSWLGIVENDYRAMVAESRSAVDRIREHAERLRREGRAVETSAVDRIRAHAEKLHREDAKASEGTPKSRALPAIGLGAGLLLLLKMMV